MAVSFVARKCTQCAGKLQYIKEKKVWQCMYCGAEIEREEQYDGLFTIKNVARQALLDTAYRRLDGALKNVTECEKIDSRYVGTLIAKIAHEMITVITPQACSERDARNIFSQLKKNYELLKSEYPSIYDEEEAFYEFLEEADIYATLILVFDSLNDTERRDFVAKLLDAKAVYSKEANGNLLSYAIKTNQFSMVDDILSNADNVDARSALSEILAKYPDGDAKGQNVEKIFATGALNRDDKPLVEKYLSESADSAKTKSAVLVSALKCGMKINIDIIIEKVLKGAEYEQLGTVVSALCKNKLSDEEVLKLVELGFSSGSEDAAICVLDCLKQGEQYLLVPAKFLISLLDAREYSAEQKMKIFDKCFEFKVDNRTLESVFTNYLCGNSSPADERKTVMTHILERVGTIPTNSVETYVLKSTADGEGKPEVIAMLFDKGLKATFFNDLLSKYMNNGADKGKIKTEVVNVLSEKGLKIDPASLIDYICDSTDEFPDKMNFIRKMINNGSQLRGDAANTYLERTSPQKFSSELFSLIFSPGSTFSAAGIEKYLLYIKDREAVKAGNLRTIIEHSGVSVPSARCSVVHLGNNISCNFLQAYLLTTSDSPQVAFEITDYFVNQLRVKINAEITTLGGTMKLKKYVTANKSALSGITNAICERYKVYSMLF